MNCRNLAPLFVPTMVLILSIAYYIESWNVDTINKLLIKPTCFLIIVIYLFFVYKEFHKHKKLATQQGEQNAQAASNAVSCQVQYKSVFIIGMTAIYVLVVQYLGFILTSVIFMGTMLYVLNVRKKWIVISFSVASTVILYFAFKTILMVPLPSGILGF